MDGRLHIPASPEPALSRPALSALVLDAEGKELENAVAHLESSNAALEEALAEDPEDQDFAMALKENVVLIGKKKEQIRIKREELALISKCL